MKADSVKAFDEYRRLMNERILTAPGNKIMKRIVGVDTIAYRKGALDAKTKEMLGLVASMVLKLGAIGSNSKTLQKRILNRK